MRAQLEKKLAQREKEKKEQRLVELAQKAREERAGIRAAAGRWSRVNLYSLRLPSLVYLVLNRLTLSRICASLGIFRSQTVLFVSASSIFFILLVNSFFEKIFNVFTCSKRNNGENIIFEG